MKENRDRGRNPVQQGSRRPLIRESTRAFFRLHGRRNLHRFLHGYGYLSHTGPYVKVLLAALRFLVRHVPEARLRAWRSLLAYMPDRYHGKVLLLQDARSIVSLQEDLFVEPAVSKKVIPFEIANQIAIENPDSIVVVECACRREKESPCGPLDVCMVMGEPYATFVLEHGQALHPRRVTQREALGILEACHGRGCVHNAFFKDVMGERLYALCNCCRCCCGGLEVERILKSLRLEDPPRVLASSGYVAVVDPGTCTACGTCAARCPFDAISMEQERPEVRSDLCMGCGVCAGLCPAGAVESRRDPARGIPLDLSVLAFQEKEVRPR